MNAAERKQWLELHQKEHFWGELLTAEEIEIKRRLDIKKVEQDSHDTQQMQRNRRPVAF